MSGFTQFSDDAQDIEREMAIKGVVLGIDWNNAQMVRQLAKEALAHNAGEVGTLVQESTTTEARAKAELFALAGLMLKTMENSAETGIHTHGGPVWKSLGKAMLEEAGFLER